MFTWALTQPPARALLEHLKAGRAAGDLALDGRVNRKFLAFHREVSEECGAQDKQHSWAVMEKREELLIFGPFYPDYSRGVHSEDQLLAQTQELLEAEPAAEAERELYVFTVNSPCLARSAEPCMLKLLRKAHEWWSRYRVRTHVGFLKCWGFKGSKENLFRDVDRSQIELISLSEDHRRYVEAAEEQLQLQPLGEDLFWAVKEALRSVRFPPADVQPGTDWRGYFKSALSILPEDETFSRDVEAFLREAGQLLAGGGGGLRRCLQDGEALAQGRSFSARLSEADQARARLALGRCWREALRDKHAESVRERLTEAFNQCTVHAFIRGVAKSSQHFLQIGRVRFQEAD